MYLGCFALPILPLLKSQNKYEQFSFALLIIKFFWKTHLKINFLGYFQNIAKLTLYCVKEYTQKLKGTIYKRYNFSSALMKPSFLFSSNHQFALSLGVLINIPDTMSFCDSCNGGAQIPGPGDHYTLIRIS